MFANSARQLGCDSVGLLVADGQGLNGSDWDEGLFGLNPSDAPILHPLWPCGWNRPSTSNLCHYMWVHLQINYSGPILNWLSKLLNRFIALGPANKAQEPVLLGLFRKAGCLCRLTSCAGRPLPNQLNNSSGQFRSVRWSRSGFAKPTSPWLVVKFPSLITNSAWPVELIRVQLATLPQISNRVNCVDYHGS